MTGKLPYPTRAIVTASDLSTDADCFPALPGADFLQAKSPQWSTTLRRSASGREIRLGNWSAPVWNFNVRHNALRERVSMIEAQKLWAFYCSCQGELGSFFFHDDQDDTAPRQTFATGDGQTASFQITRAVASGAPYSFADPVRVFWQTPTIYVGGTAVGTGWAIAPGTGIITFNSPPANGAALEWAGKYLFLCRFDQDILDVAGLVRLLWENRGLKFVTFKV